MEKVMHIDSFLELILGSDVKFVQVGRVVDYPLASSTRNVWFDVNFEHLKQEKIRMLSKRFPQDEVFIVYDDVCISGNGEGAVITAHLKFRIYERLR